MSNPGRKNTHPAATRNRPLLLVATLLFARVAVAQQAPQASPQAPASAHHAGSVVANAQTETAFPTDDEINLVLSQTERAIQQYEPLIDQEEIQIGKSAADAVAHDREVVRALETAVKAFKNKPQGFNGPLGFAFFEWLDDADRNAVLCASGASTQATQDMLSGKTDKAASLIFLAQSCTAVSTLIYTESENAGASYQRYAQGEEQLAEQGAEVAQKCADILKKSGVAPKK